MGIALYGGPVQGAVDVQGFGFLREDDRAVENKPRHTRDADAGRLDREELCDVLGAENGMPRPCQLHKKPDVHLMVQKAVNLQDAAGAHLAVPSYAFFEKPHISNASVRRYRDPILFDNLSSCILHDKAVLGNSGIAPILVGIM